MKTAALWEWRTFLDPSIPRDEFWHRLPVDAALRERLASRSRTRTDSYFDLDDIEIGLKGRAVQDATPRWLEAKVRTDHAGETEQWVKILRTNRNSLIGLCRGEDADVERLTRLVRDDLGRSNEGLDDWQHRIESRATATGARIIHIWKARTQMLVARAGNTGWEVGDAGNISTRQALVECTELRLVQPGAAPRSLGWTVCCEHHEREFVLEVAEQLLGGLGGRIMGYPAFVIHVREDLDRADS